MSILGAIAVGVRVAGATSNFIFNYTKQEYEDKIADLERAHTKLNKHLTNMENLRSKLHEVWDDENAQAVSVDLLNTIEQTRLEMKTVQDFIGVFKQAVSEFDNSNANISNVLDTLKSLISAGTTG